MLTEILPAPLAIPVIFIMKFILFIAFPMGTLAKEIRGLTDLSGAKVVQLKDDLKREFERHYTQRDEHFNRLVSDRMSDLRQTVMLLNQERLETKMKMESFETKFEELSTKLGAFTTQSILNNPNQSIVTEQRETPSLKGNQLELVRNYALLMAKVPEFEAKTDELQKQVAVYDEKVGIMATKSTAFETKLKELDGKIETMAKRESIPATADNKVTIDLETKLEELDGKIETIVQNYTQEIQQISTKFNTQIEKMEKEEESCSATGEASNQDLKQKVAALAHEIKYVNHTLGKLQTVAHEQYRTLLPTVQKVNENSDHLTELAAIVDDITSYHLKLVNSDETTVGEPVQEATEAKVSSAPSRSSENTGESNSKFRCW